MGDEDDIESKVPWRTITLWIVAASVGGMASFLWGLAEDVKRQKEQQVLNVRAIDDISRRMEVMESTKMDKRFRSDDWERERRILDAEFKSVWKAIEECKRPQR